MSSPPTILFIGTVPLERIVLIVQVMNTHYCYFFSILKGIGNVGGVRLPTLPEASTSIWCFRTTEVQILPDVLMIPSFPNTMKLTQFFCLTTILLSFGMSSVYAQGLSPYYVSPSMPFAQEVTIDTETHVDTDTSALEYRMTLLEEALAKKADKPDNKKVFDIKLDGRVFFESVLFGDPHVETGDFGGQNDILGVREAHIGVGGSGYGILDYKVEFRLSESDIRFNDVFFGIKNIPGMDYVRVGHFKVETGMGVVTSGLNSTAMEASSASQAFSPSRRLGAGQTYYFANENVRWFNGIFASEAISGVKHITAPRGMIYNSRLTFVPYYAQDGAKFLHFGGHYMYQDNPGKPLEGNARNPEFSLPGVKIGGFNRASNWLVATANAQSYNQGGLEASWGNGPLGFTMEFYAGTFGNGRDLYGGYVEARYFLTGDTRLYNKKNGVLGAVKTRENFLTGETLLQTYCGLAKGYGLCSLGAWEIYTQWGYTDSHNVFVANGLGGGRTKDLALGLNWYWNPNTRWMFEYVHSDGTNHLEGFRATEDIFATAFRFNF